MRARRLAIVAVSWAVLAACAPAYAQNFGSIPNNYFRLEASIGPTKDTFCGYLYNNRHVAARNVRLRVTGLDATHAVLSSRDHYVVGAIPASGRAYFCVSVAAEAKGYGFAVLSAEWEFSDGQ
jgi:hypothetical protein